MGKQGARRAIARSLRYRICRWEPGQVRGHADPQVSGHASWAGRPGVSATRGSEARGPRARVMGQPGAGEGSSKRQKRCLRAARPAAGAGGRDSWDPRVGDTLPWGVCSPTPSNRRQLRAGGRGAAVSRAGGVLTCWAPKHTSESGERQALSPVLSPGRPGP